MPCAVFQVGISNTLVAYIHIHILDPSKKKISTTTTSGLPSAMGLFRNLPGIFSFLLILTLSFASSRATKIEILNNCTYTVWAAAIPGGGRQLKQGETWTLNNITGEGRIWGRTNCAFGNGGRGKCESGDCNGLLECQANGRAPNTLAVYSINEPSYYEQDVFSISVLEGFNIPMEFSPAGSSSSNCSEMSKCAADVNGPCPMELRDPGGCNSPCTVFNNSQFCCTSGICEPTSYSNFFKLLCQEASAFPDYDYRERRFCPTGTDYRVVFCPSTMNKPGNNDVGIIITRTMFDQMLKHRNDRSCPSRGFYTYDAFLTAARFFDGFGTTGNYTTRKREVAAFFGQTSHETTGGWENAPDGPYAWGYCFAEETNQDTSYCTVTDNTGPCTPGKKYYGRGPFQLSWNYNYKAAGDALGFDLLNDPDLVATDPVVSFKTAIWFWMTSQEDNRSCHDIIIGTWKPTLDDKSVGRVPGYGAITNIINGGLECGKGQNDRVVSRIGFYKRYCDILGVTYGNNLDCYSQRPFVSGSMNE